MPPQRTLDDERRVRAADTDASLHPIARAFADDEVELRTETVAVALRVRPIQQRDAVEDVAVDHRNRPAILDLLDRVQEERRGHAVDGEPDAAERTAADRELAAEVVAGAHARQHVDRPHRIVRHQAAQVLDVGAAEHQLRRHRAFLFGKAARGHEHVFAVGPGAFTQEDRDLGGRRAVDLDGSPHEDETNHRHDEVPGANRNISNFEPPGCVRRRRLTGVLNPDRNIGDWRAAGSIEDDPADDTARGGRRGRLRLGERRHHERCHRNGHDAGHNVHGWSVDDRQ